MSGNVNKKNKIKVLYLTNIPSPYRVEFFNKFNKFVDLTVVYENKRLLDRNIKWKSEDNAKFNEIFLDLDNGLIKAFTVMLNQFKKNKYDAIIIGGYSTKISMLLILMLKFKNIPFILNADGGFIKDENFIKREIKKFFISSAKYWLDTGKETTKYLIHYGAKKDNIYEYPFSSLSENEILRTPVSRNNKNILKIELGIDYDIVFLSVGSYIYRKGYDLLINSVKELNVKECKKKIAYVIVGSGPEFDNYEKMLQENKIKNIIFVDFKKKNELIKYYDCADFFIFPTREDIWGLVINEAMSRGLPVISTDKCIAALELIKNNINGIIVKSDDCNELVNAIGYFYDIDENEVEKISINSLNKISKYTIENMVKSHYDILKDIENREKN